MIEYLEEIKKLGGFNNRRIKIIVLTIIFECFHLGEISYSLLFYLLFLINLKKVLEVLVDKHALGYRRRLDNS